MTIHRLKLPLYGLGMHATMGIIMRDLLVFEGFKYVWRSQARKESLPSCRMGHGVDAL